MNCRILFNKFYDAITFYFQDNHKMKNKGEVDRKENYMHHNSTNNCLMNKLFSKNPEVSITYIIKSVI